MAAVATRFPEVDGGLLLFYRWTLDGVWAKIHGALRSIDPALRSIKLHT